jgi:hypothetical protein
MTVASETGTRVDENYYLHALKHVINNKFRALNSQEVN